MGDEVHCSREGRDYARYVGAELGGVGTEVAEVQISWRCKIFSSSGSQTLSSRACAPYGQRESATPGSAAANAICAARLFAGAALRYCGGGGCGAARRFARRRRNRQAGFVREPVGRVDRRDLPVGR